MYIDVYNDGKSFVTNEVSTVPAELANTTEETRIKFVTDLAAISRGKHESNNPSKRYNALMSEACPNEIELGRDKEQLDGSPSRPFEFMPVIVDVDISDYVTVCGIAMDLATFSNSFGGTIGYVENNFLYTNLRALLNAGIPYQDIPYITDETAPLYKQFKALRASIPMFVFNHIITHTALSKEARSERVVSLTSTNYWLPEDFRDKVYTFLKNPETEITQSINTCNIAKQCLKFANRNDLIKFLLDGTIGEGIETSSQRVKTNISQEAVQNFFKAVGYPKEIYQRAMLEFRYKEMVITAWANNPKAWTHLTIERNAVKSVWKNWTQKPTEEFVTAIKTVIDT